MNLQEYLSSLKEGDVVYIDPGYATNLSCPFQVHKVVRATKTMVRIDRGESYRRTDGRERGWDGGHTFSVCPRVVVPTREVVNAVRRYNLSEEVDDLYQDLNRRKLDLDGLQALQRLLKDLLNPIRQQFLCMDCGCDTSGGCSSVRTGNGDYYMVHDELWDSVVPETRGMLCLACLGKRLGRPVIRADLKNLPINDKIRERLP
jgi:hypothetical protein